MTGSAGTDSSELDDMARIAALDCSGGTGSVQLRMNAQSTAMAAL